MVDYNYWKIKAKMDSIIKKIDLLEDYLLLKFPPKDEILMDQYKKIIRHRRTIADKKKIKLMEKNKL